MKKQSNDLYILVKVSDDKYNGNHPNFILEGMQWKAHINSLPVVGERFHFGTIKDHHRNHLFTSTVTENMNKNGVFKTRNSTYQLKKYEEQKGN